MEARTIYILGGKLVVSKEFENKLRAEGYNVKRIEGADRAETAAKIAEEVKKSGYQVDHVFLAEGYNNLVDALAIGPVSAREKIPVLLTKTGELPPSTIVAIKELGVKKVTILGQKKAISTVVQTKLEGLGCTIKARIGAGNRYETALAIAREFFKSPKKPIIARGDNSELLADGLAGGYLGASLNVPVLLTDKNEISTNTMSYIRTRTDEAYVLGGETAISKKVFGDVDLALKEDIDLDLKRATYYNITEYAYTLDEALDKQVGRSSIWRKGWVPATREEIKEYLNPYNFLQFEPKLEPKDEKEGKVTTSTLNVRTGPGVSYSRIGQITQGQVYTIFSEKNGWYKIDLNGVKGWVSGGYMEVLSGESKNNHLVSVEIKTPVLNVRREPNITSPILSTVSSGEVYVVLDKINGWYKINAKGKTGWISGAHTEYVKDVPVVMYQFMVLSGQAGVTVEQMNSELVGKGILEGKGASFIEASKKYNVNELYLISHSILETGHGDSELANGVRVEEVDGKPVEPRTVYNMYGINAFDRDPVKYGSERAYKEKWFTPEIAIVDGAHWISKNYINHSTYNQDTLYKMKYNPRNPGQHQYATDIAWAHKQRTHIDNIMEYCQKIDGAILRFDIPKYAEKKVVNKTMQAMAIDREEELKVESINVVDAKTISVAFKGIEEPIEITLDEILVHGDNKVIFTYHGVEYTENVNYIDEEKVENEKAVAEVEFLISEFEAEEDISKAYISKAKLAMEAYDDLNQSAKELISESNRNKLEAARLKVEESEIVMTEKELQAALNNPEVKTIFIGADIILEETLEITNPITIYGEGYLISGSNAADVFSAGSDNVVFKK